MPNSKCPITGELLPSECVIHPKTKIVLTEALVALPFLLISFKDYQMELIAPWESELRTHPGNDLPLREIEKIDRIVARVRRTHDVLCREFDYDSKVWRYVKYDPMFPQYIPDYAVGCRMIFEHLDELLRLEGSVAAYDDLVIAHREAERVLENPDVATWLSACPKCRDFTPTSRAQSTTTCCACGAEYATAEAIEEAHRRTMAIVGLGDMIGGLAEWDEPGSSNVAEETP